MIYVLIAAVLLLLTAVIIYGNNKTDITNYDFSNGSEESVRLVHLSDFHSKASKIILKHVAAQAPDIICITGDYIDDSQKNKRKMLSYAKELTAIAPVVYITGNHERRIENFDSLMQELKSCGFKVLLNEHIVIHDICFLGLDENQADFNDYKARKNGTYVYKDMSKYFKEIEKYDCYKIVLSHFPENFKWVKDMNYSQYDFDLQLSGHAHGGQWILPFIGPVFSPGQGFKPKYAKGCHGTKPTLVISRGIGNAEFPIRIFNHPEINVITINPSA